MTVQFIPARVPIVDPRTGLASREFYLFLQNLFSMSGGVDNALIASIAPAGTGDFALVSLDQLRDELAIVPPAPPALPPADDLTPALPPLFIAADDVLPMLGALRDEVAMLRRRVDELALGAIVL